MLPHPPAGFALLQQLVLHLRLQLVLRLPRRLLMVHHLERSLCTL
jgi:hypothetical protein